MSEEKLLHDELILRLRETEKALAKCEKARVAGDFTAAVVHEVNNPLEAITNLVFLLEIDASLSSQAREYLAILKTELDVLTHVTRTCLGFYRDQSTAKDVDLVTVAQASLKLHHTKLKQGDVRIRTRFVERAISRVIASEVLQVLSNLILNAMDALPDVPEPTIHVRVNRCHHGIHITVADNGPGIPEAIESKLFNAHITGRSTGTGLGLWHSKGLVLKHGGRMKFRTCRVHGKSGTVFQVWFPHAGMVA